MNKSILAEATKEFFLSSSSANGISTLSKEDVEIAHVSSRRIASLWAGYGQVDRHTFRTIQSPTSEIRVVSKRVAAPKSESKGNPSVSHTRKLKSYENEMEFYQLVRDSFQRSQGMPSSFPATLMQSCRLPIPLYLHRPSSETFEFVLSDLATEFPDDPQDPLPQAETLAVLEWLAHFHGSFWESSNLPLPVMTLDVINDDKRSQSFTKKGRGKGKDLEIADAPASSPQPEKSSRWRLHQMGTYWHLATRRDEYDRISTSQSLQARLKRSASAVHELIAYGQCRPYTVESGAILQASRRHRTLVHGDMKLENLLFRDASEHAPAACAAVDFQYTGTGLAAQDLVYFLSTSASPSLLTPDHLPRLLTHYISHLPVRAQETFSLSILEFHLGLAMIDFARFLVGWGMWGIGVG
ncbi:Ecdysteroid kinase-domain-containing protein [Chytridium lagenaria]|nr:Ecdysteroid kinase-domain-containing protein [Chytridium lagenaria]